MTNVFELVKAGPRAPGDLSARLRELADAADRGEVIDLIAAYTHNGNYCFLYGAGLSDSIVLSAMLQTNCIDRMRK